MENGIDVAVICIWQKNFVTGRASKCLESYFIFVLLVIASFFPLPYQTNTVCFPLSQKLILLIVKKHKSLEPGETIDIPFLILIQDLTNYFLLPG